MAALGRPAVARESSIGSRTASVVSEELEGGAALRFSESAPEEGAKASETAAEGLSDLISASSESDVSDGESEELGDADDDEEDGVTDGAEESDGSDGTVGAGE
jgi:hypothetical protein